MTTSPPPPSQPRTPAAAPAPAPRRLSRRLVLGGGLTALLSVAGGTAWALDRFVVDHVEISDVSAYEASQAVATSAATTAAAATSPVAGVVSGTSFRSATAQISLTTVTEGSGENALVYFVADVDLTDATALKSEFAQDKFGANIIENPSVIAAGKDAVFAINGDYYGFRDTGIVIRNGVVYRDAGAREALAFYRDGTVRVYDETATTAAALLAAGVWNTLSFGPALLADGAVQAGIDEVEVDTNFGNHSIQGLQPRTAVGVLGDNHLVFVVVDGRADGYSTGVTLTELTQIMLGLGATTAYNIDGGGSSTMVFDGALVNNPLGKHQERGTSDILYVAR